MPNSPESETRDTRSSTAEGFKRNENPGVSDRIFSKHKNADECTQSEYIMKGERSNMQEVLISVQNWSDTDKNEVGRDENERYVDLLWEIYPTATQSLHRG